MRLRHTLQIGMALLGGLLLIALVSFSFGRGMAAQSLNGDTAPQIRLQALTADQVPVYLDADGGPHVYFSNTSDGVLTLTLAVTGTVPVTLTGGPVFDRSHQMTTTLMPWSPVLTYTVSPAHSGVVAAQYVVTQTPALTASLWITFVQDMQSPTVTYATPPLLTLSPLISVSQLESRMYYGVITTTTLITIQGTAADTGSGLLDPTTANAAFDGMLPALSGTSSDWSFAYSIPVDSTEDGAFVVTAQDRVGHVGTAVLTYTHDGALPVVELAVLGDYYTNVPSVSVAVTATDSGSGLDHLCLSLIENACDQEILASGAMVTIEKSLTLPGEDGEYVVYLHALDRVRNVSAPVTDTVFLDRVDPTVVVTATWVGTTDTIDVTWSGSDPAPGSGLVELYRVEWREVGYSDWVVLYSSTNETGATLFANGMRSYEFKVTASDRAGNTGTGETLLLDKQSPGIAFDGVVGDGFLSAYGQVAGRHTVYFDNTSGGALTLTLQITGQEPASLQADPVFDTAHTLPAQDAPWTADLVYVVAPGHTSQYDVVYTATNSLGKTATLVIDFVQDVTPPDVQVDASPVETTSPFIIVAEGAPHLYYGPDAAPATFTLRGTATDAESGLDGDVTATPALGTITAPSNSGTNEAWAFEYQITSADTTGGEIVVTALDLLGHAGAAVLPYTFDDQGPVVTVAAARRSADSVQLTWSATDAGAGVATFDVSVNGVPVLAETTAMSHTWTELPFTASYDFEVTAVDRVGNAGVGTARLETKRVYLPTLSRNYATLTNGAFEAGLQAWHVQRGGFAWAGETYGGDKQLSVSAASGPAGGTSALLGSPSYTNGTIPVGYARLSQSFVVEQDKVEIKYHIRSYDVIGGAGDPYFDTFEIVVDDAPLESPNHVVTDGERDEVCKDGVGLNPEDEIVVKNRGLVVCGGRAGAGEVGELWAPTEYKVTLDLSKYQGKLINLSFYIWSREYTEPARNDRGWYNTYVYVNDVQYVP